MKPSPLFSLAGLGMILVGIFFVLWSLNYGSALSLILIGFLAWIVSVGLKLAWSIQTNKKIINYLKKKFSSKLSGSIIWAYIGSLTGIFECGVSLLFVLFIPSLLNANWQDVIGFGIGFGAIESIILGLISLAGNLYFLIKPSVAPKEVKELWKIYRKYSFTAITTPIVERVATILIHVFTSILIVLAAQQNMYYLFWLSFFFKSFVDSVAAWSRFRLDIADWKKPKQIWFVEFLIIIFGIISLFGVFCLFNL
jgi:uncharacterized membrane protein YhfC